MTTTPQTGEWRISPGAARKAIDAVRALRLHAHFTAYLALRRAKHRDVSGEVSEIRRFMDDFLRVPGAPSKYPYLRPFNERRPSSQTLWGHDNVAGNFAPSSLRPDSPLVQLVEAQKTPYSLLEDHYRVARRTMANDHFIPVCPLAVMLFRDYGIIGEQSQNTLVELFCAEFGIARDSDEFLVLYSTGEEFPLQ